jgi:hypothetical protein
MGVWREIVSDDKGMPSATRVAMLAGAATMCFVVAMVTLFTLALRFHAELTAGIAAGNGEIIGIYSIFASFVTAIWGIGKLSDNSVAKVEIKANAPVAPNV